MSHASRNARRARFLAIGAAIAAVGLAAGLALWSPHGTAAPTPGKSPEVHLKLDDRWKLVDKLIEEQKFEAAAKEVRGILTAAKATGDQAQWTRALIREVQLRMGLHGYETAVRFLKEEPWPEAPLHRTTLNLFYGHALVQYAQAYAWEIGKRERVAAAGPVDLKKWTREQIHDAAAAAYAHAWRDRVALGREPVGRLAEYLSPNDYPAGIRGTLRDAVTYLFVELLANSGGWTPEQANDLFRLPLADLIAGDPGKSAAIDPANPAVHPLLRVGALLDDLESWHRERRSAEGALEARLERLRRLHAAFDLPADRERITGHLRQRLPAFRGVPWWSMGMATLAEFVQAEPVADNLVRARQIAIEGQRAYPDSVGGQRANHIARRIEAPDFQVTAMAADGPGRRSVLVSHRNLPELHFRAYPVDFEARLARTVESGLLPSYRDLEQIVRGQKPAHAWRVKLPATPDFKDHRTFVTPPMASPGVYVVAASARADFGSGDNRVMAVNVNVTDLVMLSREDGEGGLAVTVLSGRTGKPVAGATVSLYRYSWRKPPERMRRDRTGEDGEAAFPWQSREDVGESKFLVGRLGEHLALDQSYFSLYKPSAPTESDAALIYTDRSIYRPEQEVRFKIVAFRGRGDQARYRTLPGRDLRVSLYDANGQEVDGKKVRTNRYGTASGIFRVPAGRALGQWHVATSVGGSQYVRVEEYKRPTFEVKLEDPEAALRLNKPATVAGTARYYFGLPVTAGSVRWRVTREPVYPWWWDWDWWGAGQGRSGAQAIAGGTATLGADGKFKFTFTPEADERAAKGLSYRYAVAADVTDEGGETRSADRAFRLGTVAIEAAFRTDAAFFRPDATGAIVVTRTDLDGVPRAGKGSWRLIALRQPAAATLPADMSRTAGPAADGSEQAGDTEEADGEADPDEPGETSAGPGAPLTKGDRLRARWETGYGAEAALRRWADEKQLSRGDLAHGADGEARVAIEGLAPGAYRLRYRTEDPYGATFEAAREFVVAGAPMALPAVLMAEHSAVPVGGTARILVASGLPDQVLLFDLYKAGKLVRRQRLASGRERHVVEIPVGEGDRGGFGVKLTVLRDHQLMTLTQAVFVPWDDKQLQVSFSTFRDKLRPGGRETWKVTVKGPKGAPVEAGGAELLAYMYDRSLDLFAPHAPADPLALYPNRTGVSWARASLGSVSPQWLWSDFAGLPYYPSLSGDRLIFFDSYGIGGPGYRHGGYRLRSAMPMAPAPAGAPAMEAADRMEQAPARKAESRSDRNGEDERKSTEGDKTKGFGVASGRGQAEGPQPAPLRSNFAETAFFQPHLEVDEDGAVGFEFEVPDSVTAWNVWVHAITADLKGGAVRKEARSVKDLMVRPYMPRFLREGDKAELQVVVNNATDKPLTGQVTLDIVDPDSGASILGEFGLAGAKPLAFKAAAKGSGKVSFPIAAPKRVRPAAFKVVARAGDDSDGELRPLPVLPGRMHLAQSRFVTLRDVEKRDMVFADMAAAGADPSLVHDSLVVTVDAQLFYQVLEALPYLIEYPYECTEQTMNRFVSTGIVSSVFEQFPAIGKMAAEFAKRETQYASWADDDPNRKLTLEESPWLRIARGGSGQDKGLAKILDPRIARATRDTSLAKLRQAQLPSGAFPWWAGGPPSPYITLYLMHGFAKAVEFQVDVPKDVVQRGWNYLADEVRRDMQWAFAHDCCWEFLTFVNYVASSYPDQSWTGDALTAKERKQILDFSFRHWKRHSPYLKGYLALTLKRMGRPADAKLVWDGVMDSAKTTRDEGTSWAPEDRAWLWYNDTIETHAYALRTLMELEPRDARRDGIVQWLLLNKKLNHWKSTRATAEVIYSLVHYLKAEKQLGIPEHLAVQVGPRSQEFRFDPEKYTGKKNQVVVPGAEVDPKTMHKVVVSKTTKGFAFASATWHYSTEKLPAADRGDLLGVNRSYFRREHTSGGWVLRPLQEGTKVAVGDQVEVHLSIRARHPAEYVHLRDPRPAGFEPDSQLSKWKWDLGLAWYEEIRDSGTNFFFEALPQGEYTLKYRLRAAMPGTFRVSPATLQSMYAPEFNAFSAGTIVGVAGSGDQQ
ncbi:MAG: hypothetical protein FJZ01_00240 [Candidatus Sericytochromatia bacterium]|nr:hypothetical protein [Candidatus Tanganyikabacteria bacterium]